MVTAATRIQSVSRSDGGSAPRDDLYSPECQRRPGQLDEPQRLIPSEDPGCVRNGLLTYCLLLTAQYTVHTAYYFFKE